jgi:hypothetical protein
MALILTRYQSLYSSLSVSGLGTSRLAGACFGADGSSLRSSPAFVGGAVALRAASREKKTGEERSDEQ